MFRGVRRWGLALALALGGLGAGGFALGGSAVAAEPAAVEPLGGEAAQPFSGASYRLKVDAVAYHLPGKTASGLPVGKGVVAVDPKLIPLGTKLHVPGYGRGIAADVGAAIKGRIIDLWMPSDAAARKWGRRTVVITVYR